MAKERQEDFGVLVGFSSRAAGKRMMLCLQCVDKPPPHCEADVKSHYIALSNQQAAQLGHYLFEMTEQSKPAPRSGWLARMFMR